MNILNTVTPDDIFIVFNNSLLENPERFAPQGVKLGMTGLCRLQSVEHTKNDFSNEKEMCFLVLYLGGGGTLVPKRYVELGLISIIYGSDFIPRKEDEHILDNLDVEKELQFYF